MKRILCVEDNSEMILLLQSILKTFSIDIARDLKEARQFLSKARYDLVTLDVSLPDGDGLEFLSELAALPELNSTPVFMLTAKDETAQKVSAFAVGADDYIVKPFEPNEFLARIENKLRKMSLQKKSFEDLSIGDLTILVPKQKVYLEDQGIKIPIQLTSLEFRLLFHLVQNQGKILSRQYLLKEVWGENMHVTDRTVDTHIGHLRKKMNPSRVQIQTVVGEGYRINI